MEINKFIEKLEIEFDDIEKGTLQPQTNFRDIDEWSSMYALIIIAFIEIEYEVTVTGEDLIRCNTVEDLFQLVNSKV